MSNEDAMGDRPPKKGVKTKLFGFTLVLLGVLDSLLFLRGGTAVGTIQFVLIGLGLLIWVNGMIRQRNDNSSHREN